MADDAAPPPSPRIDLAVVRGLIGAARTRLRLQGAIEGAATGAILASASALTAVFLVRTEAITEPTGLGLLAASAGVVAAGALLGAIGTHDDEHVARRIDRASGLADRLSTAIAFERALRAPGPADDADADTTALMHAAMRDAAAVASVLLVMVSPSLDQEALDADPAWPTLLRRQRRHELRVIPILLRPCLFEETPFGHLEPLPQQRMPVLSWENKDEAWLTVLREPHGALTGARPGRPGRCAPSCSPSTRGPPRARSRAPPAAWRCPRPWR